MKYGDMTPDQKLFCQDVVIRNMDTKGGRPVKSKGKLVSIIREAFYRQYRDRPSITEASFKSIRNALERRGIVVLLAGNGKGLVCTDNPENESAHPDMYSHTESMRRCASMTAGCITNLMIKPAKQLQTMAPRSGLSISGINKLMSEMNQLVLNDICKLAGIACDNLSVRFEITAVRPDSKSIQFQLQEAAQ